MRWDINLNPNTKTCRFPEVEAPSAIEACHRAMPDRTFKLQYPTKDGWHVVEADNVTTHEVCEHRSG